MDDDYSESIPVDDYAREGRLYRRLIGLFQTLPSEVSMHSTVSNPEIWNPFNKLVDDVVLLGHSNYSQFKMTPEKFSISNGRPALNIYVLKNAMSSMLWEMSAEFYCQNPNELIGHQTSSAPFVQQFNNQNQQQKQEQEIELTFEQKMETLERFVKENMSPEQIATITPQLDAFKKEPSVWKNGQSLIQGLLSFGKDIAAQTIAAVLAFYITKGR